MSDFARRTDLGSNVAQRRYLWTDAYAVRDFLDLHLETGVTRHRDAAVDLIDAVHRTLGRHRADDARGGWLSGLPEDEAARHPTRGGLGIGTPLPERGRGEPLDERLEWERDGQYFHYLTQWMNALARAADVLDAPLLRQHAVELAAAVLPPFLRRNASGTPVGIVWKMSADLSRPQVPGTNPHDALDGYVTFRRIARAGELEAETGILRELAAGRRWGTGDPLGLGGLLSDAARLAALPHRTAAEERMMTDILTGADAGLQQVMLQGLLDGPAERRLAFRELGLAIGLNAASHIEPRSPQLDAVLARAELGARIVTFWAEPRHRETATWQDHRDINEVMLATALIGSGEA